ERADIESARYWRSSDLTQHATQDIVVRNFWESVARPYAERLITKPEVEQVVRRGLQQTNGNYRKLVEVLGMPDSDYRKFMSFLRHNHCHVDFRPYRKKAN